jgi:hypothetical protein
MKHRQLQKLKMILQKTLPLYFHIGMAHDGVLMAPPKHLACGYFVTTVLQQIGLKIERSRLAQLGSEEMMKEICGAKAISHFTNYCMLPFINEIKTQGNGIFIVGLDNHTGFVWNNNGQIYFVHASGRFPYCVKKEKVIESITLWKSKYKVLAKVSGNKIVLEKWLGNDRF